jgi:hypothetical protein
MVKLIVILLLLATLPHICVADYTSNPRTISLQVFKDRFTTGELVDIYTAYAGDAYIRTVVMKLSELDSVELDSPLVKSSMLYLTTKSIISLNRATNILK